MPRLTPSGKRTAVADVEDKLAAEARKKGLTGRRAAAYTYGTLNKIGLKRGNKTTAKGKRAAKGYAEGGEVKDPSPSAALSEKIKKIDQLTRENRGPERILGSGTDFQRIEQKGAGNYAKGGKVRGRKGKDAIPAKLTKGEYVIKRSAAKAIGKKRLDRLNQVRTATSDKREGGAMKGSGMKAKKMKVPAMRKAKRMAKPKKTGMVGQYKPSTPPSKAEKGTARPSAGRKLAEFPREPVNVMEAGGDLNAMARRRVKVTS